MSNKTEKNAAPAVPQKKKSVTREYIEAIAIAFLLALFIRTFIVQAFKIPSGSMKNTLLIGDHILVTKYSYGLHIPNEIPLTSIQLFPDYVLFLEPPKRYDIIVFKFPGDESRDYIKRVIGLPGETIQIRMQEVYINGEKIADKHARHTQAPDPDNPRDNFPPAGNPPFRIPEGHVFVMGDNRENSLDSRFWGTLDIRKIRGRARRIYWSWEAEPNSCFICGRVRWERIGMAIE